MSKTIDKVVKTASKLGLAGLLAMSSGCFGAAIISGYGAQCNQPGAYAFGNSLNAVDAAKAGNPNLQGQPQQTPVYVGQSYWPVSSGFPPGPPFESSRGRWEKNERGDYYGWTGILKQD
jgi:hypothetical protein